MSADTRRVADLLLAIVVILLALLALGAFLRSGVLVAQTCAPCPGTRPVITARGCECVGPGVTGRACTNPLPCTPTPTASPTPPAPTPTPTPGTGATPTPTASPTPVSGDEELRTVTRLRLDPTKVTWTAAQGGRLLYDNKLQFIYVCPPNDDSHCWKVYFQNAQ